MGKDRVSRAATRVMVGFDGQVANDHAKRMIRDFRVQSLILFKRNVDTPAQVAELVRELQGLALEAGYARPLLLAIDQEGGRVQRLREPWTVWPAIRRLGELNSEDLVRRMAEAVASELSACGIALDFAPVVDVDTNPRNPIIGDRSFGSDPEHVGRLGAVFIEALQTQGVAACAKHFPGHGDTSQDSHVDLPRLPHSLERLRRVELVPFRALAQAGVAAVMTAHVVFEPLDSRRPATLSPQTLRLLRDELGFQGCCVSDDLEMKAVAEHFPLEVAAPGAVAAGVDQLLVCHRADLQHRAIDHIRQAIEDGRIPRARLVEAGARVGRLLRFAGPPPDPKGVRAKLRTPRHLALAERLPSLLKGADPTERA